MNFLLRNNSTTAQSSKETHVVPKYVSNPAPTAEGLISENPSSKTASHETRNSESYEFGDENDGAEVSSEKTSVQFDSHIDVTEDDGMIIIPYEEVPENWTEAPDILSFRSLDRSFVFPGEQIGILACLSAYKQDTEIITPFTVAAVMNKSGIGESTNQPNENTVGEPDSISETVNVISGDQDTPHCENMTEEKIDSHQDVSTGESLLRMEDHRRQTEQLLQRFKTSHFFVRISESNEPLWSKRRPQEDYVNSPVMNEEQSTGESSETAKQVNSVSASLDREHFDAHTSGGLARGAVKCVSLSNGDIMVLLHVNVGVQFVKDPILEILQFDKYKEKKPTLEKKDIPAALNQDPYGELLRWLLPLENSIPPLARPLSPPTLSTSSSIRNTSPKPMSSGSSSSPLFSFGHLRSYSMSSLPPNVTPPPAITTSSTKPTFDPEDSNQYSFKSGVEGGKSGKEGLLSFRGVPLQQDRFSVRCGLEGIFTPGRRWRRKIELIQPVEIHSFSVDCNTEDIICIHVKNVSPAHAPDIVVFIDAITIIVDEASKGGSPLFLPIACVESGTDHTLPNLALRELNLEYNARRGEEHSFILKPASTLWKHSKGHNDTGPRPSRLSLNTSNVKQKHGGSPSDQYAVLVSCRCNYTESKLFFKQPISWRPRISRDLIISVASEMSTQTLGSDGTKLPVQVLTLQASNMTSDDLTLRVLAPSSFTSPSVVPLSGSPSSPFSPLSPSFGLIEKANNDWQGQKVEDSPTSEAPNSDLCSTHLWLQSRVPLGCVPSQSTATVKLEVLPLTDGIITLDSLQIEVKEKGSTYIPEQSLKINATTSIATGIF